MASKDGLEVATVAGGCFWCFQPIFQALKGVDLVEVGYSGGHVPEPTYRQVCTDETGHAEAVQVAFDPLVISYRDLLEVFFSVHDPTTLNRQGHDVGTQYRSAIFYHDEGQKATAQEVIAQLEEENVYRDPIVTQVVPLEAFYRAEGYHQDYFAKNPTQGYCRAVIAPKLSKFRKKYASSLKA